jgi:anti-sigma B factor antagonist
VTAEELAKIKELVRSTTEALGRDELLLDFRGIEFVSSDFLVALVRLRHSLQAAGKRLTLCNLSASVEEVFAVTGLSRFFQICPDQPESQPGPSSR